MAIKKQMLIIKPTFEAFYVSNVTTKSAKTPLNAGNLTFYAKLNWEKRSTVAVNKSYVILPSLLLSNQNGQRIWPGSYGNIFIYLVSRFPVSLRYGLSWSDCNHQTKSSCIDTMVWSLISFSKILLDLVGNYCFEALFMNAAWEKMFV